MDSHHHRAACQVAMGRLVLKRSSSSAGTVLPGSWGQLGKAFINHSRTPGILIDFTFDQKLSRKVTVICFFPKMILVRNGENSVAKWREMLRIVETHKNHLKMDQWNLQTIYGLEESWCELYLIYLHSSNLSSLLWHFECNNGQKQFHRAEERPGPQICS